MTPGELAAVRGRLEEFAAEMFVPLARRDQRDKGATYVRGLLLDGRRKSMQPMAVATMLVGFSQRTTAGLEAATETALGQEYDGLCKRTLDDLTLLSEKLPGWREVTDGSMEPSVAKELYVSCTSAGLNAIAGALFHVHQGGASSADAIEKMAKLDWRKTNWVQDPSAKDVNDVFFEGTVLQEGNIVSNRPSFESAAKS